MIIAVLSDTHLPGLTERFCRRVEEIAREVDHFFHLGDVTSPSVLQFLNSFNLTAVAGNMDPLAVTMAWPARTMVELAGQRFGLVHGWGAPFDLPERVRRTLPDVDCACFGHSHAPFCQVMDGVLLFNPGSCRDGSYGRLTVGPDGLSGQHLPF